ncbi:MAG: YihY family inner membrane protein, partial [Pseudomonadales bacterium]|nr:YihY family inner membrane protein [Pseudomonadales bacterium]
MKPFSKQRIWAKLVRFQRFVGFVARSFWQHDGPKIAAHLTFTSMFAVVPVMTVTYSILALIPDLKEVGDQIQSYLFQHFVPSSSSQLQGYFSGFADQAANLTGVGLAMLFVTAVLMLRNIEKAFNRIWHVTEARKGATGLLLYWAILSISPLLMGVAFAIPGYVASVEMLTSITGEAYTNKIFVKILPIILSACAFSLAYAAIPNTKVPVKHAFGGGLLAAISFEMARRLMTTFVSMFPSYQLIYGAFATVPIFLIWIYISWMILLVGAEFVQALTNYRVSLRRSNSSLGQVLDILYLLFLNQKQGVSCSESALLKQLPGLSIDGWEYYKHRLQLNKLIAMTDDGELILSRNLQHLTLFNLFEVLNP